MCDQWALYDPSFGWETYATATEAREAYDAALSYHRDRSTDGWHEDIESLAVYMLTPVLTTRLRKIAGAEDATEDGEKCRRAGWDFLAVAETVDRREVVAVPEDERARDGCAHFVLALGLGVLPDCETDGHYLCRECARRIPEASHGL